MSARSGTETKWNYVHDPTSTVSRRQSEHIVFVNSSMVCGGAERVISILAQNWVASGRRVTVITIHSDENDHYILDPRIGRICLNANRASGNVFRGIVNNISRIRKLRRAIVDSKPSVVISFQDTNNIISLLATVGLRIPVVVSERNDPRMRRLSPKWSFLRYGLYRTASALVLQTQSLTDWGTTLVGADKVHVLPNPVTRPDAQDVPIEQSQVTIVAAGRLVRQKGFDILLVALARCERKWLLKIAGDGPDRAILERQAAELGIADQVEFLGTVEDLNAVFRQASLYVLSSRFEGFPNVLAEAMSCGLAVVSFDCPSGPSEIVRHEIDGLLVSPEDPVELSKAIDRLMLNSKERNQLASKAPEVANRFSAAKVVDGWNKLIESVGPFDA